MGSITSRFIDYQLKCCIKNGNSKYNSSGRALVNPLFPDDLILKHKRIGLKHSSCSQYINEKGYSMDEVQMLTDHARRESVKRYASVQLEAKRRLLEGKQGRNL